MNRLNRGPARIVALTLAVALLGQHAGSIAQTLRPIVILVSIDGWRWDYIERHRPGVLGRLAADGVRAEGLIPNHRPIS